MRRILFFILCISLASAAFAETDVSEKNTQLIQAAKDSNFAAVQTLLTGGADINAKRTTDGVTALMWAALNGNTEIVKLLLEKGADINAKSNDGLTALVAARSNGHKDIVLLLDKTAAPADSAEKDVSEKNTQLTQPTKGVDANTENFALHKAAYEGNLEEVKALIAKGADVNAKDNEGKTPLVVADQEGHTDIAELLRKYQDKNKIEKPAANELSSPNNITFKSAEPAPEAFDAWSFRWMNPTGDPNAKLWYVVIQPDGQEYFRYDLPTSAASRSIRSDFKTGSAGGDPRVFYNEYIRFSVCASKGKLVFPQSDSVRFKFEFFQKNAEGKIEWNKPFKTIDSIIDSSTGPEKNTSRQAEPKSNIIEESTDDSQRRLLATKGIAYETEKIINSLVDYTITTCIPTKGEKPNTHSFIVISDAPIFSVEASKKAWLLVVAGAFGQTMHENPNIKIDEIWVSDTALLKQYKAFSIKADLLHNLQQKVKNDQINLEQMYLEIMSALKEHKVSREWSGSTTAE